MMMCFRQRFPEKVVQRLYYGERTGDQEEFLNTLILAKVELPYGDFSGRAALSRFSDTGNSGSVQTEKRIVHPGEVNALRQCYQCSSIVCTHSDTSTVYVWDTDSVPHTSQNKRCTKP